MERDLVKTSKFLSLVLRHRPELVGMQLDSEGWLAIDQLIANSNKLGHAIDLELIHQIVATNEKQRFALSEDGLKIRANQGHSIPGVDLNLLPIEPPEVLFHGTVPDFLGSIRRQGLLKRSRNHVHLSADQSTAKVVGSRRGSPVVLVVLAQRMYQDGHKFFRSENGVWLTDSVPVDYIKFDS